MSLTPETLPKHELAGLRVRVVESADPSQVGVEGTVVSETTNTLRIAPADGDGGAAGVRQVPKRGSTFEFAIDEAAGDREAPGTAPEPGEAAAESASPARTGGHGGDGAAYVTVDGGVLVARPAERTENGVDSKWR